MQTFCLQEIGCSNKHLYTCVLFYGFILFDKSTNISRWTFRWVMFTISVMSSVSFAAWRWNFFRFAFGFKKGNHSIIPRHRIYITSDSTYIHMYIYAMFDSQIGFVLYIYSSPEQALVQIKGMFNNVGRMFSDASELDASMVEPWAVSVVVSPQLAHKLNSFIIIYIIFICI